MPGRVMQFAKRLRGSRFGFDLKIEQEGICWGSGQWGGKGEVCGCGARGRMIVEDGYYHMTPGLSERVSESSNISMYQTPERAAGPGDAPFRGRGLAA